MHEPVWLQYDACIISNAAPRPSYEVYVRGRQVATRSRLDEAKEVVEKQFGPLEWSRKRTEPFEVTHRTFGDTTEFTDPVTLHVAELPKVRSVARVIRNSTAGVHRDLPSGPITLYHGTTAANGAAIKASDLRPPAGVNPWTWYMLTTSKEQAARYSMKDDSVVLEFRFTPEQVDQYLGLAQEHNVYGFEAEAYGVAHPIPGSLVVATHPVASGRLASASVPPVLYHGTRSFENVDPILREGIRPTDGWAYLTRDLGQVVEAIGSGELPIFAIRTSGLDLERSPFALDDTTYRMAGIVPPSAIIGVRWATNNYSEVHDWTKVTYTIHTRRPGQPEQSYAVDHKVDPYWYSDIEGAIAGTLKGRVGHRVRGKAIVASDYEMDHRPLEDAAPMHDLSATFPDDVYEHPEWYSFGEWTAEAGRVLRQAQGKPDAQITIYRALPAGENEINTGDWVTTVRAYAALHLQKMERGREWHIVSAIVPARTLRTGGNDIIEWGYWGPSTSARTAASRGVVTEDKIPLDYPYGGRPLRFAIYFPEAGPSKDGYYEDHPGLVAFADTFTSGNETLIAYMSVRRDHRGTGLARLLTQRIYDHFTTGIDWGEIMEPEAGHLRDDFAERYPDRGNWYKHRYGGRRNIPGSSREDEIRERHEQIGKGRLIDRKTWMEGKDRWDFERYETYGEVRIYDGSPKPAGSMMSEAEWDARGGAEVGYLGWYYDDTSGVITIVDVAEERRRNGLATRMLEYARAHTPVPIEHSNTRNVDGRGWSRAVGSLGLTYYHGTHHEVAPGTVLRPSATSGIPGNWGYGPGNDSDSSVWLTDDKGRAQRWAADGAWASARRSGKTMDEAWAFQQNVHVYEVEPIGEVQAKPDGVWMDYAVPEARVLREVTSPRTAAFEGDRWVAPHEELLSEALWSWKAWPSDMGIHMHDAEHDPAHVPSSGSGKKMRAYAEALIEELERAGPTGVRLYRGSHVEPRGWQSWSELESVAKAWAKKNGGQVWVMEAGAGRGLRVSDYVISQIDAEEREWIAQAGGSISVASALDAKSYDGEVGNTGHITRNEQGTIPTAAIAKLMGVRREIPGDHRNKKGQVWEDFKADIAANGILEPIFITVDPGEDPKISEGNHRRDAAVELGMDEVPVEIRYFGHAEIQGTVLERFERGHLARRRGKAIVGSMGGSQERAFNDRITMRFTEEDQGERKPRQVIRAYDDGKQVGELNWYGTTGTIHHIEVEAEYMRQGLATAMWNWGQDFGRPKPKHSGDRTTQGDAWARSVGGPIPRRNAGWADDPDTQRKLEELAEILTTPTGRPYDPIGDLPDPHAGYGGYISQDRSGRLTLEGRPIEKLYRVVDPGEWELAQQRGYLQSYNEYTRASAKPDERWRNQGAAGVRGYTLEIDYDPADDWHASAEGYAATRTRIPLSRVRKIGVKMASGTEKVLARDWNRGDRVVVARYPNEPGTVVRIQGQGIPYQKVFLSIAFDSDPDRPALYDAKECLRLIDKTAGVTNSRTRGRAEVIA